MSGPTSNRELSPLGERLRSVIERSTRYSSRADFLAVAEISRAQFYKFEYGDAEPGMAHLTYWAQLLNVDRGWLAAGLSGLGQRLELSIADRSAFLAHAQVDSELALAVLRDGAVPDDITLMTWAQIVGQDYLWLKYGPNAPGGAGPGGYTRSRAQTARQALLDDPRRMKHVAGAADISLDQLVAFRDGDDGALDAGQIKALFTELGLVEPSMFRDRSLTVSSAPEPMNLREYMVKLQSGKAMKRRADTDPQAQGLLDALRIVVNFTGDMPTPEDWHAVRLALEHGEKLRPKPKKG